MLLTLRTTPLSDSGVLVGCTALCVVWTVVRRWLRTKKELPLPPGPPRLPLIGSVHHMPASYPWVGLKKMADEQYGDVMYINALGKSLIVLSSAQAAKDLLERRSSNYSTRPHMIMLDLMGFNWSMSTMPYGDPWATRRKLFNQHFTPTALPKYQHAQRKATHSMLQHLLATPEDFSKHVKLVFGASIMDTVYGIEITDMNNRYLRTAEHGLESLGEAAMPGRFFVDVFPFLLHFPSWFPGIKFKNFAAKASIYIRDMARVPWEDTKRAIKEGTARPSIVADIMDSIDNGEIEEGVAIDAAGIAYGAGADTVSSTMTSFFLAMLHYPEVQRKAQAELDAVVGHDRLPTFEDRENLPYIAALIKELLRWMIVAPLSFTHSNEEEDEYHGYRIPKGSMIMVNSWGILHDPEVFENPSAFIPERFIKDGSCSTEHVLDPEAVAFGFGRRICPGRFFASASMFLVVASVLATFDISPPEGEVPPAQQTSSIISHPVPFRCTIKSRSKAAEHLIRSAASY